MKIEDAPKPKMKKTSNENVIAEDGDVTRDSFVIILPPRHFGEVGGRFLGSTQFHVALVLKRHRVILREADENQRHAVSLSLERRNTMPHNLIRT